MLNENWVRCFLAVARTGSFTGAAKELYMSQQAVSKQVRRLEEELEHPLFLRTTQSVTLTDAGEKYYQMFLKWSVDYDTVRQLVDRMDARENRLRIGMLKRMNSGRVPEAVHGFRELFPDCVVAISHADAVDLLDQLEKDDIDIAILYDDFIKERKSFKNLLDGELFGRTRLYLAIAENHPLAGEDVRALSREMFLVCMNKGESKAQALVRAVKDREKYHLGDGPVRVLADIDEVNMLTELGEGFSFCSSSNLFAKNEFIRLHPLDKVTEIRAVWKKKTSAPVKDFLRKARETGPLDQMISSIEKDGEDVGE